MPFARADSLDNTESATFADVDSMTLTCPDAGEWGVLFSCVLKPDRPAQIEFRITVNDVEADGVRPFKIDVLQSKTERIATIEANFSSVSGGEGVKVQWRVLFGKAIMGDRRMSMVRGA